MLRRPSAFFISVLKLNAGRCPSKHNRMAQRDRLAVIGLLADHIEQDPRSLAIAPIPVEHHRPRQACRDSHFFHALHAYHSIRGCERLHKTIFEQTGIERNDEALRSRRGRSVPCADRGFVVPGGRWTVAMIDKRPSAVRARCRL